jgi:hypothetical protein
LSTGALSRCCAARGDAVDRQVDAAPHALVLVAFPVAVQQLDLHVVERVEVGKRLRIERLSSGLASSSSAWPVMLQQHSTVLACSFDAREDRLAQGASFTSSA